jgi:hypothetical protein
MGDGCVCVQLGRVWRRGSAEFAAETTGSTSNGVEIEADSAAKDREQGVGNREQKRAAQIWLPRRLRLVSGLGAMIFLRATEKAAVWPPFLFLPSILRIPTLRNKTAKYLEFLWFGRVLE